MKNSKVSRKIFPETSDSEVETRRERSRHADKKHISKKKTETGKKRKLDPVEEYENEIAHLMKQIKKKKKQEEKMRQEEEKRREEEEILLRRSVSKKKHAVSDSEEDIKTPKKAKRSKNTKNTKNTFEYEDTDSEEDINEENTDNIEDKDEKARLEKLATKSRLEKILIQHEIENPSLLNNEEIIKPIHFQRIFTKIYESKYNDKKDKVTKISNDGRLMLHAVFNGQMIKYLKTADGVRRGDLKKKYAKNKETGKIDKTGEFELMGNVLKKSHIESAINILDNETEDNGERKDWESEITSELLI